MDRTPRGIQSKQGLYMGIQLNYVLLMGVGGGVTRGMSFKPPTAFVDLPVGQAELESFGRALQVCAEDLSKVI